MHISPKAAIELRNSASDGPSRRFVQHQITWSIIARKFFRYLVLTTLRELCVSLKSAMSRSIKPLSRFVWVMALDCLFDLYTTTIEFSKYACPFLRINPSILNISGALKYNLWLSVAVLIEHCPVRVGHDDNQSSRPSVAYLESF